MGEEVGQGRTHAAAALGAWYAPGDARDAAGAASLASTDSSSMIHNVLILVHRLAEPLEVQASYSNVNAHP